MADPRAKLTTSYDRSMARELGLRELGIVYPVATVREARIAGLGLAIACALLDMETGGGRNVFGHDAVDTGGNYEYRQPVTEARYKRYRTWRNMGTGRMQGVGPCQLTWWEYQDRADALGGCWRPSCNMAVGFELLADYLRGSTTDIAIIRAGTKYNGSDEYGRKLVGRVHVWRRRLGFKT